jgi:hypothetical protein
MLWKVYTSNDLEYLAHHRVGKFLMWCYSSSHDHQTNLYADVQNFRLSLTINVSEVVVCKCLAQYRQPRSCHELLKLIVVLGANCKFPSPLSLLLTHILGFAAPLQNQLTLLECQANLGILYYDLNKE